MNAPDLKSDIGEKKLMALGKYPDTSLVQARERHSEARKLYANGKRPKLPSGVVTAQQKIGASPPFVW